MTPQWVVQHAATRLTVPPLTRGSRGFAAAQPMFGYTDRYLENNSTYKVAIPLKICRMTLFGMVAKYTGRLQCKVYSLIEI